MTKHIKLIGSFILLVSLFGCFKDLDTVPIDPDVVTGAIVYDDPASYKKVLAKLYAGLALSGQQGPAGQSDISGIDEGFGQYLRGYWYHQELTTDEAVIGWNDQTIKDFHNMTWTPSDGFTYAFYSRVFYQISLANEFLRETTDAKLAEREVDAALQSEIKLYRAEVKYLRAISYWHALDIFRDLPFATENDLVGVLPVQKNRAEVFTFIESELKAIEGELPSPRNNEYGRADKAAVWALLAKLYLNAQVYVGQNKNEECLTYCEQIINAGYTLEPTYQNLFLADNHNSKEIIFPVAFDGINTRTWGGMTFIIRAGIGGSMPPAASGVAGGWGGTRTTRQLVEKFPADLTGVVVDFNNGATASYPKLYIPGSHQGFDATQTSNSLASPLANKIYEGYKYFPANNTEIFFTQISSNTAPKFGDNGANGSLETGGAAIVIPQAGFYYLRVDLNAKTYTIEHRDWSIIGTATGGLDIPLTYDTTVAALVAPAALMQGSFRFRVNGNDMINLGDSGANGILEANGTEVQITKSGDYKVFLDIDKPDYTYSLRLTSFDRRGIFYSNGQNLDIDDLTLFTEGYAVSKFKNVTSTGQPGKDSDFPDTDFPMFRLADFYLMAAEAVLRGAKGGDKNLAATYVNEVRKRAYTGTAGNIEAADLTLDFILDERARELYWECHRRSDLVRFGKLSGSAYIWAWKGGVKEGAAVDAKRDVFPIPAADLNANPNLQQIPEYR